MGQKKEEEEEDKEGMRARRRVHVPTHLWPCLPVALDRKSVV